MGLFCTVSGRCNQSFSALFYLIFDSLYWCIDGHLSTSYLGCKALCMVLSFLVFWYICWSSPLAHFKKDSEWDIFIPLMSSCDIVWFRVVFSISCDIPFNFFFHRYLWWLLPIFLRICKFHLLREFWFFSLFGSSIPIIICRFPLLIINMAHFSMQNSIPMSWLYILTACIRVSGSFSFLATIWCHPCTLGDWSFLEI